jgi:hypothetical protein
MTNGLFEAFPCRDDGFLLGTGSIKGQMNTTRRASPR